MTHHSTVSGRGMAPLLTNQRRLWQSTETGTGLLTFCQPDASDSCHCGRPGWAEASPVCGRLVRPGREPHLSKLGPEPTGVSVPVAGLRCGAIAWRVGENNGVPVRLAPPPPTCTPPGGAPAVSLDRPVTAEKPNRRRLGLQASGDDRAAYTGDLNPLLRDFTGDTSATSAVVSEPHHALLAPSSSACDAGDPVSDRVERHAQGRPGSWTSHQHPPYQNSASETGHHIPVQLTELSRAGPTG